MALKDFEDRIEQLLEGTFARAFKSELQPVELGRRLIKETELNVKLDADGVAIAPNKYVMRVSSKDFDQISEIRNHLTEELSRSVREHVAENGYRLVGPVTVALIADSQLKVGILKVSATHSELADGADFPAWLESENHMRIDLKNQELIIGRQSDCDIVIEDENISRRHAMLIPDGDSFILEDTHSTNGCLVNGVKQDRVKLAEGDEICFGPVKLWFRV